MDCLFKSKNPGTLEEVVSYSCLLEAKDDIGVKWNIVAMKANLPKKCQEAVTEIIKPLIKEVTISSRSHEETGG